MDLKSFCALLTPLTKHKKNFRPVGSLRATLFPFQDVRQQFLPFTYKLYVTFPRTSCTYTLYIIFAGVWSSPLRANMGLKSFCALLTPLNKHKQKFRPVGSLRETLFPFQDVRQQFLPFTYKLYIFFAGVWSLFAV